MSQRPRNVCVVIGSLRLVTGDQLQGREAATAAPAHSAAHQRWRCSGCGVVYDDDSLAELAREHS